MGRDAPRHAPRTPFTSEELRRTGRNSATLSGLKQPTSHLEVLGCASRGGSLFNWGGVAPSLGGRLLRETRGSLADPAMH